jgi:hypothetical protein
MHKELAILALALLVLGCEHLGQPVQLLTGVPPGEEDACFLNTASGQLVADPNYGTAIIDERNDGAANGPIPVAWRPGFTAVRDGAEVTVLAPDGHAVATTGHKYLIDGGYQDWPGAPRVFWACDRVEPR